jgi:hypothetical protein
VAITPRTAASVAVLRILPVAVIYQASAPEL